MTVKDTSGRTLVEVPRAELSLSLYELLLGRIVPRALEIDEPRIRLLRAEDGAVTLDLGSLGEATEEADAPATGDDAAASAGQAEPPMSIARLFRELGRPPQSDLVRARRNRYSQLRLLRVRDAVITVVDRQLGAEWQIPRAEIDLRRREAGGVQGEADISLALGTSMRSSPCAPRWIATGRMCGRSCRRSRPARWPAPRPSWRRWQHSRPPSAPRRIWI